MSSQDVQIQMESFFEVYPLTFVFANDTIVDAHGFECDVSFYHDLKCHHKLENR